MHAGKMDIQDLSSYVLLEDYLVRNEFLTETRGTGIINHTFHDYQEYKGEIVTGKKGALIAMETGTCFGYSLNNLQPRGILFVEPGR